MRLTQGEEKWHLLIHVSIVTLGKYDTAIKSITPCFTCKQYIKMLKNNHYRVKHTGLVTLAKHHANQQNKFFNPHSGNTCQL